MPGLQQAVLNYGRSAMGMGERAGMGLGRMVGGAMRNPFAARTGIGAAVGGLAGGMYGGSPGSGFSFGGAMMGAGMGAAGARYGGAFMKAGMTSGIGMRGAAMRTAALGRSDFRVASARARGAAGFIGNHMTAGYNRIRGLFR